MFWQPSELTSGGARTARNELPRTPVQDQLLAADAFAVVRDRMPGWLDGIRQSQQIDTNEVARLADGISAGHAEIAGAVDAMSPVLPEAVLPHAQTAFADMAELLSLLNPPQQSQQDQQQDQRQNKRSGEQNAEQPKGGEKRDESPSEDRSEKQAEENAEEAGQADRAEMDPEREEAEETMQAVLMQEKERAAEKRRRERAMPARVGERDW